MDDGRTHGRTIWMDGQIGWTDEYMDGQTDGWMNKCSFMALRHRLFQVL